MKPRSPRWRSLLSRVLPALLAASLLVGGSLLTGPLSAEAAVKTTFGTKAPKKLARITNDSPVEVGLRFVPSKDGAITSVRFYKASAKKASTPATVSVWSASGKRLARAKVTRTTRTGWITVKLSSPVKVKAKRSYVVSAYSASGTYVATRGYFSKAQKRGYLALPKKAGVFKYGKKSRFPNESYKSSNYWIDPGFEPSSSAVRASSPKPTATASAKPTATASAKPTATASAKALAPSASASSGTQLMGWELTSKNVGLAPHELKCEDLPLYTGSMTPASGARISNVRIVGHLDLRNGDIIVEKSCIQPGTNSTAERTTAAMVSNFVCGKDSCPVISAKSVIIRDSEFSASSAPASQVGYTCAFRGTATLQRNYMHGMGNGICFYGTGMKHDAVAEQNYVTNVRSYGDSHNEAATIRDFMLDENPKRVARFTRNRLDIAEGNISGGLFIQPTGEDIDSLVVEGNLIEGGGYNLFLSKNSAGGNYSNLRALNNRFSSTGWGPSSVQGGPGWSQWTDNYVYNAKNAGAKGAAVRAN